MIVATIVILAIALVAYYFFDFGKPLAVKRARVLVNDRTFNVEVADSAPQQMRGLSGRESLPEDSGMLFVFNYAGMQSFWMKDMRFPIDIIWIKSERIIGVEKNVPPQPDKSVFGLKIYTSPEPADRVLEINAGLADKYGFKPGDTIRFEP